MPKLPKLKVIWHPKNLKEEITCDFEESKDMVFNHGLDVLVFVEGQMITSYERLVELAAQGQFKNHNFLTVVLLSAVAGG
jgi:hypothetical protein